jgi:hypothetical protein
MRDVPALAEHLANMVTAHDTPRYRTVLKDNIKFLERELSAALSEARAEGAREERERLADLIEKYGASDINGPSIVDPDDWKDWPKNDGRCGLMEIPCWLRAQSNTEG